MTTIDVAREASFTRSTDSNGPSPRLSAAHSAADDGRGSPPDAPDVLSSIKAVVYDWDLTTDRLFWSPNVGRVLSEFPASALTTGAAFAELMTTNSEMSRLQAIKGSPTADSGDGAPYRAFYSLLRHDGAKIAVEDIGRWFADDAGRPAHAHGMMRIVPDQQGAPALATPRRDPLTGAFNRGHLVAHLDAACADAARRRSQFAVLVIGLEKLVEINQTHGYDVADEVIAAAARRIGEKVREGDMLARYLGGKFVVVLNGGDAEQAAIAAQRLVGAVSRDPIATLAGPIEVSVRIGGALAPEHGRGAHALLQRAEEAFDLACRGGADRFALYAADVAQADTADRELSIQEEIRAALREERIVLAYQPVIGATPGRAPYFEALLRLRCRDGRLLGPEILLRVAEKAGLIAQIDERVLELALQRMGAEPDLRLSVNLSASTLQTPGWVGRFAATLAAHPGVAGRLIVEVTETVAIADIALTAEIFATLRRMGVKVAMDDFGAGHTSFRSLRGLGVDIIKIDGAFVQNIARSADDRFFVRTLVELARHLNIETVAEWVEDSEAKRILTEWGVDYLQGNHLGRAEIVPSPGDGDPSADG